MPAVVLGPNRPSCIAKRVTMLPSIIAGWECASQTRGKELLLKVIETVSCKCAPQGQFFPEARSFGQWTGSKANAIHLKEAKQEKEETRA